MAHDPRDNTAAYIANWLTVLKADKRAIITAAAKAQAAADYLHDLYRDTERRSRKRPRDPAGFFTLHRI